MSNTQLTNQQYLDSIEKEYNALLEKGNKGETKLSDEEIDKIAGTLSKAAKDIAEISDRKNVFIDTDIKCKKWSGVVSNYR